MPNIIKHKRSSVAGNAPTAAQLEVGELGINLADKKIFTKDTSNTIIELGGGGSSKWTTTPNTTDIGRASNLKIGATTDPVSTIDLDGNFSQVAETVVAGAVDCSLGNNFYASVSANTTFAFSNPPASRSYEMVVAVDYSAGTVTWPTVTWTSGSSPTMVAGMNFVKFKTNDGGTTWYAYAEGTSSTTSSIKQPFSPSTDLFCDILLDRTIHLYANLSRANPPTTIGYYGLRIVDSTNTVVANYGSTIWPGGFIFEFIPNTFQNNKLALIGRGTGSTTQTPAAVSQSVRVATLTGTGPHYLRINVGAVADWNDIYIGI